MVFYLSAICGIFVLSDSSGNIQVTINSAQEIEAGALVLALSGGHADLQEVTDWADKQISLTDDIETPLIDLSLSQSVPDAVEHLNSLSAGTDVWLVASCFLGRFYAVRVMQPKEALSLAEYLYKLAIRDDAPAHFKRFISHWDAIGLAIEGTIGNPIDCVEELLKDIRNTSGEGMEN